MENYMYFNKAPPLNPLSSSVPYQNVAPYTTVFAKQASLPPAVMPYMGPQGMLPAASYMAPFVDNDRRMMRTHLATQK